MARRIKVSDTIILTLVIMVNSLLAIAGLIQMYYLHIDPSGLFFDEDLLIFLWISVAIILIDIVIFAFVGRIGFIAVIINSILAVVGMVFMYIYAVIPIGISEVSLLIFGVIDILNGLIAWRITGIRGIGGITTSGRARGRRI